MLNLREKAHIALNAHRGGRAPAGHPMSPVGEVDELSALGGRTRVITRMDSVSPSSAATLSPTLGPLSPSTATRVVPVPLYDAAQQHHVHPSVLEYVRTFAHAPAPPPLPPPPVTTPSYSFGHAPRTSASEFDFAAFAPPSAPHAHSPAFGDAAAAAYMTYFPVFDYGPAGGEAAFPPLAQSGLAQGELALAPGLDGLSDSPHSTWNAFVAGLGM
jgi:hypothetical protein